MTRNLAATAAVILLVMLAWRPGAGQDGPPPLRAGNAQTSVAVWLDPARTGYTTATIALTGPDNTPRTGVFVQVQAVMPLMGHATPQAAATAMGNGRYTVPGIHLMTTGPWELHVRLNGGDDLVLPFQVAPG